MKHGRSGPPDRFERPGKTQRLRQKNPWREILERLAERVADRIVAEQDVHKPTSTQEKE